MNAERRKRLFEILETALERSQTTQRNVLKELCQGDAELFREAKAMLDLEAEADAIFTQPAVDFRPLLSGSRSAPPELETGSRLGPYRIVGLLGRGGMGSVYRAVREDDFEKQVAVKFLRGDLATPEDQRRFHVERQILARFEHPTIARLLDGGTTSGGQSYLVMEYIEGQPIDAYCEDHRLSTRQRLELFRQVLPAVAYAHRNLVVHRDLKPGNVLVSSEGVPRLVDFGIAKLLDDGDALTAITAPSGSSPLTPRYASPEQLRDEPVSTASDVFSLGVLLYQLLTRYHPWWREGKSPLDLARGVCEDDPIPPSKTIGSEPWDPPWEVRRLRRALTGDLDAIVLKALDKDPQHRYSLVEHLDEDLGRYLEGLPVRARQGARAYLIRKLLWRYKGLVAVALLILGFSIGTTVLWRQAEGERRRADSERAEAVAAQQREERVSDFLKDLFQAANPDRAQGRRLTAEELLAAGRERLVSGLDEDPALAAQLAGTLGDVYRDLGLYGEALELLERSVELLRELRSKDDPELVIALNDLAGAHYYVGNYGEAARRFREVLALRRRLGHDVDLIALTSSNLASSLKQLGDYAGAGKLYREVLELREALHGPEHSKVASSLYALGSLLYETGELDEAVEPLRRALAIRTVELGERHTRVATVVGTLGRVLHARGKLDEAEDLLRHALGVRLELLGEAHTHVALSRRDLGALLLDQRRIEEAGRLIEEALMSLRRSQAPEDWVIASAESLWGSYLTLLGRLDEAEPLLVRSYSALRETKSEISIYTRQASERLDAFREAR